MENQSPCIIVAGASGRGRLHGPTDTMIQNYVRNSTSLQVPAIMASLFLGEIWLHGRLRTSLLIRCGLLPSEQKLKRPRPFVVTSVFLVFLSRRFHSPRHKLLLEAQILRTTHMVHPNPLRVGCRTVFVLPAL